MSLRDDAAKLAFAICAECTNSEYTWEDVERCRDTYYEIGDRFLALFDKAVEEIENRYKAKAHDEPIVAEKMELHPAYAYELVWDEVIQEVLELVKGE